MKEYSRIICVMVVALMSAAMAEAMPFVRCFTAHEYGAHNRNFDILCDAEGRVYVANFEGLLMYDGATWRTVHTPAISRITKLYRDSKGTIWFGGYNVLGTIAHAHLDSVKINYIVSDKEKAVRFGEINSIGERNGQLTITCSDNASYTIERNRKNGRTTVRKIVAAHQTDSEQVTVHHTSVTMKEDALIYSATSKNGVRISTTAGVAVAEINSDNGLCSNTVNAIDTDGKGTVWGATDNGLFCITTSNIYSRYTASDGLHGQVTSILASNGRLYVGTMLGLYELRGNTFVRRENIHQACWQLAETAKGTILAATPEGVFEDGVRQLTTRHTLSLLADGRESFLTGEINGIYRHYYNGRDEKLASIDNVMRLEHDSQGGVIAQTLYGETYYMAKGGTTFRPAREKALSRLFEYDSPNGYRWTSPGNGNGLLLKGAPTATQSRLKPWMNALSENAIRAAYDDKGTLWMGGTFGLISMDYEKAARQTPYVPKLIIRSLHTSGRSLHATYSIDVREPLGKVMYSHRTSKVDEWSEWSEREDVSYNNLFYGKRYFEVRARDAYGNIIEAEPIEFEIPAPLLLRWYFLILYVLALGGLIYLVMLWRMHRVMVQNQKLEQQVQERTKMLQTALDDLASAQHELIRKEREATVGKLTKGLIDRILNPMNYINNFSHLSLGLVRDLQENLEDDKENMTEDIYEDCVDVADMMKQNLEKIEQHGLSTTRILKSMEEMLKDRSANPVDTDIVAILQQNCDMLAKYYEADIKAMNVAVEWEKPQTQMMVNIVPEYMSKVVMSMLGNGMYALRKMYERQMGKDYVPELRIALEETDKEVTITIRDNGIGIEEGIRDKVFDPFFTTKPTAEASGVGLYLSQQIVQDCGGSISVDSEKYEYTEFRINLPKTGEGVVKAEKR